MNNSLNINRRKRALITGASSGIGESFAKVYAEKGYDLVLVARREDRLKSVASKLNKQHGVSSEIVIADLSLAESPQHIFNHLSDLNIEVDAIVNNAGYALARPFSDTSWEEQLALINVTMVSLTQLCHLFIPQMKKRNAGEIINVASISAYAPELPGNLYNAVKSFVVHMSEALDMELKPHGVNCLALCPGLTDSEFHETMGIRQALNFIPKWRWMSSYTVASQGYEAVTRGDSICINGRLNRSLVQLFGIMPNRLKYYMGKKGIIL